MRHSFSVIPSGVTLGSGRIGVPAEFTSNSMSGLPLFLCTPDASFLGTPCKNSTQSPRMFHRGQALVPRLKKPPFLASNRRPLHTLSPRLLKRKNDSLFIGQIL